MWIVRLALRRPYTFVVMSMLIVILGVLAIFRMPTDIFPEINIPVASVIWSYGGISPEDMAEVVTIRCERSFTVAKGRPPVRPWSTPNAGPADNAAGDRGGRKPWAVRSRSGRRRS